MDITGKRKIKELVDQLHIKNVAIKKLEKEVEDLLTELQKRKDFQYIFKEKIPDESGARKAYMADISVFYRKIFKEQIENMISRQKDSLAIIGRPEREYEVARATINAFYLIDDWMLACEREHLGDINEARQVAQESLEIISNIKEKING